MLSFDLGDVPERLEDALGVLVRTGPARDEHAEQVADPKRRPAARPREPQIASHEEDQGQDLVRTYLRQMSRVPLLTREGEVAIGVGESCLWSDEFLGGCWEDRRTDSILSQFS